MSERKVLNKYYPPDFDPNNIPRSKIRRNKTFGVRLMAPCNMKCNTCGEYIAKGKKFNSRKEDVDDETYLGLRIYRFYIRCPMCMAEIVFKTDPEHTDYVIEAGATRNFQAQILAERQAIAEAAQAEEDAKSNPMKMLENRTKQSRHEMDMIEKLEELRELNQRQASVNFDGMLQTYSNSEPAPRSLEEQELEDEQYIRSVFGGAGAVKRIRDDSDSDEEAAGASTRCSSTVAATGSVSSGGGSSSAAAQTDISSSSPSNLLLSQTKSSDPGVKPWERSLGSLACKKTGVGALVRLGIVRHTDKTTNVSQKSTSTADTTSRDDSSNPTAVASSKQVCRGDSGALLTSKQQTTHPASAPASCSTNSALSLLGNYSASDSD